MTTVTGQRIAVVGAGPGGLTCARILQRHGIDVTVYDRDADEHVRNQGGSLDLHPDDGQLALREAGLIDGFFALARPEGQEMRQIDATTGEVVTTIMPEEGQTTAPEIDRGQLRDLLLQSLTPGTVRWGRSLAEVTGPDTGPRTLTFTDGTSADADLVIGADGAWSRVRRAISTAVPSYTGVDFLESWFDDTERAHPAVAGLVGGGSAMARDADGALFAQRNSGGHTRLYMVRRRPLDWLAQHGLTIHDTDLIREAVTREYAGWSPDLLAMINDNDGEFVDRPLFVLPAPHTWTPSATVTLLGDAAHLMPPVGVGVNLAMLDGCELALAVTRADSVDTALRAYESTMLPRSTELAVRLDGHADFLLDDGEAPAFAVTDGQTGGSERG